MQSERQRHWEAVYATKADDAVSWFQPEPTPSLAMIDSAQLSPDAPIIDIGGGTSRLAGCLLDRGFTDVTVLDISSHAVDATIARLRTKHASATFLVGDITQWQPTRHDYRMWHDRAVFHFLTDAADRRAYLGALDAALAPGGWAIFATFALTGPERCSGLPVRRYSPETLQQELGPSYRLLEHRLEAHRTPFGGQQDFTWGLMQKVI